jgi:hypothetical protein
MELELGTEHLEISVRADAAKSVVDSIDVGTVSTTISRPQAIVSTNKGTTVHNNFPINTPLVFWEISVIIYKRIDFVIRACPFPNIACHIQRTHPRGSLQTLRRLESFFVSQSNSFV